MALPANRPLTVAEARQRLRRVAGGLSAGEWIRRHPRSAVVVGLVGGLVLSRLPVAPGLPRGWIRLLRSLL